MSITQTSTVHSNWIKTCTSCFNSKEPFHDKVRPQEIHLVPPRRHLHPRTTLKMIQRIRRQRNETVKIVRRRNLRKMNFWNVKRVAVMDWFLNSDPQVCVCVYTLIFICVCYTSELMTSLIFNWKTKDKAKLINLIFAFQAVFAVSVV